MIIAKVKGNVVSTNKTEKLNGLKMLIIVPVDIPTQKERGDPLVAIDTVGSGQDELVMCVSGSSARMTDITKEKPVDLVIVGIIDSMEIDGKVVFKKYGGMNVQEETIQNVESNVESDNSKKHKASAIFSNKKRRERKQ